MLFKYKVKTSSIQQLLCLYFLFSFMAATTAFAEPQKELNIEHQGKIETQQQLLILMDADLPLYRNVLSGFALESDFTLHIVALGQSEHELSQIDSKIKKNHYKSLIAIGPKSLLLCQKYDLPIFYSMIPKSSAYQISPKKMTGIAMEVSYIQQIKIIKKLLPEVTSIGILYTPKQSSQTVKNLKKATKKLNIRIVEMAILNPQDTKSALQNESNFDALLMISDKNALHLQSIETILQFSKKEKKPVISISSRLISQGALLALQVDYSKIGRQLAKLSNHSINENIDINTLGQQAPKDSVLHVNIALAAQLSKDKEWALRLLKISAQDNISIKSVLITE